MTEIIFVLPIRVVETSEVVLVGDLLLGVVDLCGAVKPIKKKKNNNMNMMIFIFLLCTCSSNEEGNEEKLVHLALFMVLYG